MAISDRTKVAILIGVSIVILISYIVLLEQYPNQDFGNLRGEMRATSFAQVMKSMSWEQFKLALDSKNYAEIEYYVTDLLLKLLPFLLKPPLTPVNISCQPPSLQIINTSSEACIAIKTPRRVGILWQFGFDVDALEIHLNELDAVVDRFFIVEGERAHSRFIHSKPLIWPRLRHDSRFAKFSKKVVHLVVGEAVFAVREKAVDGIWKREGLQETLRWEMFLEWNNKSKYFREDDILGFGDADEVPNRNQVNYLKHCHLPSDPVDIGIWYPYDGTNTIYASDWPVQGHPQTLGDPTFWTLGSAMGYWIARESVPTRRRGGSYGHLVGGMHLSRYAYPPFQMTKLITRTETSLDAVRKAVEVGILFGNNEEEEANEILNEVPAELIPRIQDLETFRNKSRAQADAIVKMPWFLKCNRNRFPGFNKLHDMRLDAGYNEMDNLTYDTWGLIIKQ